MTIRRQALLFISLIVITLVGLTYTVCRLTLVNDLEDIEHRDVEQRVEQTLNTLSYSLSELEATNGDWASWDDTYAFIESGDDPDYISSNLVNETFTTLNINLMVFIHTSGRIVFSKAVDLDSQEEVEIAQDLRSFINQRSRTLSELGFENPASGFILLHEGPMLISSQPILRSDGTGPSRGALIFSRYLDARQVDRLTNVLGYSIDIIPVTDVQLHPDVQRAMSYLLKDESTFTYPVNYQYASGYTLIKDLYNRPILVLKVNVPRNIFQAGQASVATLVLSMLGISLLIGGVCVLGLNTGILSRLSRIVRGIDAIRETGKTSTRISVGGSDELSIVADTFNAMLVSLEYTYAELERTLKTETETRKRLEEELDRRIQFTRALVHELKTPLTPVLVSSELLLEEIKEGPLVRIARNISEGASNLSHRIDELIDLARSEIGTLDISKNTFEPAPFLEEIYANTKPVADRNGQHLDIEIPASLGTVHADQERMRQIVLNLMNNALKFTPAGGKIVLRAKKDAKNLIIEVEDNGRGISQKEQETLFQPYYKTEDDRARLSGLGLGLFLAKHFVELHGGHIWVKSQKGEGSRFSFSIPVESVNQTDNQEEMEAGI